jgi:hypothetical protein
MNIFHYDPADGRLVGAGQADPDPLTPGAWLVPAFATTKNPPVITEGKIPVRGDGDIWVLVDLPEPEPEPVEETPDEIRALSPAQFWMQLAIDGDESEALAIIDTLPRPQQILALRARQYERYHELLIQLATALGKDSTAIDTFFRAANAL